MSEDRETLFPAAEIVREFVDSMPTWVPAFRKKDCLDALESLVADLDACRRHSCENWRYCKGGTGACEDCVGSCGVEEFDEHWEAVKALNDQMMRAGDDA